MDNIPPDATTNRRWDGPDEAGLRQRQVSPPPENSPLFVPKRVGFGWSPNLANPVMARGCVIGVVALVVIGALILLFLVLLPFLLGRH